MKFPTERHLDDIKKDKFEYKILSKKILDEILLKMELPNCFGIYGNWGSGKSTLLNFILKHLTGSQNKYQNVVTVYFEPWKYEYSNEGDLMFALLSAIKRELGLEGDLWKKVMVDSLVIGSGLLRSLKVVDSKRVIEDFELIEDKIYNDHEKWIDKVEEFKEMFEEVINKGLEKKKASKLIIIIDDLDRCLPENAVRLLEGMKNHLTVSNTLYLLAIDRRVMSEMIEKKYGLHCGYGDEYLMKIIHYYYELPKNNQLSLVKEILDSYDVKYNQRQVGFLSEFLKIFAGEPRITKHILHQFCMNITLSSQATKILEDDDSDVQLQFLFVATYLLIKFPKLFLNGKTLDRLRNIQESAMQIINRDRATNYEEIVGRDKSITPHERNELESIFRYPINSTSEASPPQIINISKLDVAIQAIRKII